MDMDDVDLSKEEFSGKIPDHSILRCIGIGAYGRVWLAVNSFGNFRAVKIIERNRFKSSPEAFNLEWEGIKKYVEISTSHPRLVGIFHAGRNEDDSYFYYVMELGDDVETGRNIQPDHYRVHTLQDHIFSAGNRLSIQDCVQIGVQLSGALEQFHIIGLLHRDVKPSNIIFINGVPKLTDMGLVAHLDEGPDYLGTEGFVPSEGSNSIQADIFSLGKTLYEAATGLDRKLFPNPPRSWKSQLDRQMFAELNDVLVKACHPKPSVRYQSAREMQSELIAIENGKSLRRYRLQEHAIKKLTIFTKISFGVSMALVALVLLFFQKSLQQEAVANSYREFQFASISRYLKDGQFVNAFKSLEDTFSSEKGLNKLVNRNIQSFESSLIDGWIRDFPILEYFGAICSYPDGAFCQPDPNVHVTGIPTSLNNCVLLDDGRHGLMVGDKGFAAVIQFVENQSNPEKLPGKLTVLKTGHDQTIRLAAQCPITGNLIIGGDNWTCDVYDAVTLKRIAEFAPVESNDWELFSPFGSVPNGISFSPDGKSIAICYDQMAIAVFEVGTYRQIGSSQVLNFQNYACEALTWSSTGKSIVGVGYFLNPSQNIFVIPFLDGELGQPTSLSTASHTDLWDVQRNGDSNLYYLASGDGLIRRMIYDEEAFLNGKPILESITEDNPIGQKGKEVRRMFYHDALDLLGSACWDNILRLNSSSLLPKIIPELPHSGKINGVDFGHKATRILTVCHDGTYYVWNLAAKSYMSRFQANHFNSISGMALKYDNDRQFIQLVKPFAAPGTNILEVSYARLGISDHIILQLQFSNDLNGVILRLQGSDSLDRICAISLSEFSNNNSDPIHLMDLFKATNREFVQYDWNSQTLIRQMVTQSDNYNIIIQNAHKKHKSFTSPRPGMPWILDSAKKRFYVNEQSEGNSDIESTLKVLDVQTLNQIGELHLGESDGFVSSVSLNQAGDRMLITYSSNDFAHMKARFYKIKSTAGHTELRFTHLCDAIHPDGVLNGYVFHDGKRFATLGEDGEVKIWSLGRLIQRFKLDSQVYKFDITPDEKRLAATTRQGNIYLWDLEKYMPLGSPFFIVPGSIADISISGDGGSLAAYDDEQKTIYIRDVGASRLGAHSLDLLKLLFASLISHEDPYSPGALVSEYIRLRQVCPEYFQMSAESISEFYAYLRQLSQNIDSGNSIKLNEYLNGLQ